MLAGSGWGLWPRYSDFLGKLDLPPTSASSNVGSNPANSELVKSFHGMARFTGRDFRTSRHSSSAGSWPTALHC